MAITLWERVGELYREGGVLEIGRGIRDLLYFRVYKNLYVKFRRWESLTILDYTLKFRIVDRRSLYRATDLTERPVMEDFVGTATQDDIVWDVGANIGSYSILALKQGSRVVAFEPGTKARMLMEKNIGVNGSYQGDISIEPVGLSDRSRQSFLSGNGVAGDRRIDTQGEEVTLKRADEIRLPLPTILKIDVEGHECEVLQGFGERLTEVETIYVETHNTDTKVRRILKEHGFEVSKVFNVHNEIIKAQKTDCRTSHRSTVNAPRRCENS